MLSRCNILNMVLVNFIVGTMMLVFLVHKPQSVGNRAEGLANDFVNENIELVCKLSFVLQLSDPDDYEGGNLQLLDEMGKSYIAPRERGTIILFDSRTMHRVLPVKSGLRKSIVGWTVGPRWK